MHFVGDGLGGRVVGKAVEIDGGESCLLGTEDVGVEVVTNHEGGFLGGMRLPESVVEELGGGFVGSCIFAEDDGVEVVEESAGMEFFVLHFVETIAAHVHTVAFPFEIIHQFSGTIDKTRFDGTKAEELVAGFEAVVLSGVEPFAETLGVPETLDDEEMAFYLPFGILCPKADVGVPIVVVEGVGVIEVLLQMQVLIQLSQGDDGIAVGVVEGIIEIDERSVYFNVYLFRKMALKHLSAAPVLALM